VNGALVTDVETITIYMFILFRSRSFSTKEEI